MTVDTKPAVHAMPVVNIFLGVLTVLFCPGNSAAALPRVSQEVEIRPLESSADFPDAVAPGALGLACAGDLETLADFFSREGLPFREDLVRQTETECCHVHFQPTISGFRADAVDQPVQELRFNVDTLSFLARREVMVGDALDIVRALLPRISRSLDVDLGVLFRHQRRWYDEALGFHFPGSLHRIRLSADPSSRSFPWVQDYIKSGQVNGIQKILVPRMLYEGDSKFGEEFYALLDSMAGERFVRSKLSWEGGDLIVVPHPSRPGRRLLVYGNAAASYWGRALTTPEYSYVLSLEFGTDETLGRLDITGHVDYMVSFLPGTRIALVSKIVVGNQALARAAVRLLRETYLASQPPEVLELARNLEVTAERFRQERAGIRASLQELQSSRTPWIASLDQDLLDRLNRYVDVNCHENNEDCFSLKGQERLLESDLPLLSQWVGEASQVPVTERLPRILMSVIESQLPGYKPRNAGKLDDLASQLKAIGFQVIRVPRLAGDPELQLPWSGISYANCLIVDHDVFVPTLGLGDVEDQMLADFERSLPAPFRVVPIFARRMLIFNGGIHCIAGILYGPKIGDEAEAPERSPTLGLPLPDGRLYFLPPQSQK